MKVTIIYGFCHLSTSLRQYHGVPLDGRPMDIKFVVGEDAINDIVGCGGGGGRRVVKVGIVTSC